MVVRTDLPIRQVLRKPDLVRRMVAWSVQLFEFDITFERRGHVKARVMVDFLIELTPSGNIVVGETDGGEWYLSVDGSSNQSGSMRLAKELEAKKLKVKSDSKLVTGQVNGEYQARDPQLVKYQEQASAMATAFDNFTLVHVPRE
ncbi:hypothetical protein CR513_15478, partial [Mucuna pruriens]